MDWARAVEINRLALARIVVELLALLGVVSAGRVERLLLPAESALRRLIVLAARGLCVKPWRKRPMPQDLVIIGSGSGRKAFALFDKRQNYDFVEVENPFVVMVQTHQNNPYNLFNSMLPMPPDDFGFDAKNAQLARRLAAFSFALENLGHQAKRLARWTMRRENMERPQFKSPLRPGPPPGFVAKPSAEVDFVLRECHGLAFDVLTQNST